MKEHCILSKISSELAEGYTNINTTILKKYFDNTKEKIGEFSFYILDYKSIENTLFTASLINDHVVDTINVINKNDIKLGGKIGIIKKASINKEFLNENIIKEVAKELSEHFKFYDINNIFIAPKKITNINDENLINLIIQYENIAFIKLNSKSNNVVYMYEF